MIDIGVNRIEKAIIPKWNDGILLPNAKARSVLLKKNESIKSRK